MKQACLVFSILVSFSEITTAQTGLQPLDKSPMDMCYYPANYPILKIQNKVSEPLAARVIYSRPQKNGRSVFGELVEYNKVWRLGANEATELELFRDAKVNGNKLKKGRYTIYTIPAPDKWTLIFNKETDTWGAFQYDDKKDALRTDVKTERQEEAAEVFTMQFEKTADGADLIMVWDNVKVRLPFAFQ